jgi:hypothetical protein
MHGVLQAVNQFRNGFELRYAWGAGVNLYPNLPDVDCIEFDSMINLRPSFGYRSRGVDDAAIRARITDVVRDLVAR